VRYGRGVDVVALNTLRTKTVSRPWGAFADRFQLAALPCALVVLGAGAATTALVASYLGLSAGFTVLHALLMTAGILLQLCGIGLDVALKRTSIMDALRFLAITLQIGLLVAAFQFYHLENAAFYRFISILILFGFVANHYLPSRLRLPFFFALSIAALLGVFSATSLSAALWLIGIGLVLIGLCHLPISLGGRVALLILCTGGLAAIRAGWVETQWSGLALPILASIFMFRLAIYLYDIETKKGSTNIWHRLSYFFMLPNVVFPFFPVVDYATFCRTYYNDEALTIYRRGATWMLRGLLHLLVYRIVNYYLILSPSDVVDPGTFFQFIVANFGLYFRISGLFHLIVGTLLLFGFNLHETHSKFYFSKSFVDLWRNINIYWKDFMQKMFFNPSFLYFKTRGATYATSLALASIVVFVSTWALHAYQWFWLRGTLLLTPPDILFWTLLAVVFIVQTLHDSRSGQLRAAALARSNLLGPRASLVVRIISTMLMLCLLWSLWSADSLSAWIDLLSASTLLPVLLTSSPSLADWAASLGVLAITAAMFAIAMGFSLGLVTPAQAGGAKRTAVPSQNRSSFRHAALAIGTILAIILLANPVLNAVLGPTAQIFARDITQSRLSRQDQTLLTRGYYEKLTNVNRFNSQLWEVLMYRPRENTYVIDLPNLRWRHDYLNYEFVPLSSSLYNRVIYDINRWGMRDKDYDKVTPPNTYRIAMTGSSRTAGEGISYENRYETRLEEKLNKQFAGKRYKAYEILNFAVDAYFPTQVLMSLREKVLSFKPTVIIEEASQRDLYLGEHHAEMMRAGVASPFPFLDEITKKSGARPDMPQEKIERLLWPYRFEILTAVYENFVKDCRAQGIVPIWIYVPQPEVQSIYLPQGEAKPGSDQADQEKMKHIAETAGFLTLDLSHAFGNEDLQSLQISDWDRHPNEKAHGLIMAALYDGLVALDRRHAVDFGFQNPAGAAPSSATTSPPQ